MPHWLSGLCQMACFLMQPMNAFTCYLFAMFAFLTESFLACNFICLYFVYCSLLCVCVCVWFFFKSFWKKPAGWSCRHRVGALFSSFFSRKMNSGVRCSGKQDFCKSWAYFLAVSGVLIGWVNSFVVQLNHCIVDEVYHTLGNGREYTRS